MVGIAVKARRPLIGVLCLLILCAGGALAQTNDEVFAGLQLSLIPPGARSLALGGAFIGRSDDATAAYSNPAGLLWLREPEVSFEARSATFTTEYVDGGRFRDPPTFEGIDRFDDPQFSNFESDTTGLSFLSYAHPSKSGRWAIAGYRHETANFEVSLVSQGPFSGELPRVQRAGSVLSELDLLVENYGVSGAFQATKSLWLGLGLSYYRIDVDAQTRRFEQESLFEPARFTASQMFLDKTMTGDDEEWGLIAGLLWSSKNRRWSAGAVYRQGPEFDVDTVFAWGPLAFERNRANPVLAAERSGPATFHIPDVFGVGFSVRPTPAIAISFDYSRVEYSNLEPEKNVLSRRNVIDQFKIDDANELHLGFEYVFLSLRSPLALRAGAWSDPDHQMRFVSDNPDDIFAVRYREGDDELHLTGGLGLVFKEGRFQLDLAFDASDRADIFSLSAVATF